MNQYHKKIKVYKTISLVIQSTCNHAYLSTFSKIYAYQTFSNQIAIIKMSINNNNNNQALLSH